MSYRYDKEDNTIVMDGWEKGITASPYLGVANIQNLNTSYYPGVAYVNYRRQAATLAETDNNWYAGAHSTNVSNNSGWTFSGSVVTTMTNPVQHTTSPNGINYILDDSGNVWQQSAANSTTFNLLQGGSGRRGAGAGGIAFWNNYLAVFGASLIEFCGDGTGDSGITYKNWNKDIGSSYTSVTDISFTAQTFQCTGAITAGSTTATLSTAWTYATNSNATLIFSNGETRTITITINTTSLSWSGVTLSDSSSLVFISSPGLFINTNESILIGNQVTLTTTGTLPSPLSISTTYYATTIPVSYSSGYVFQIATTPGGTSVVMNNQGIGSSAISVGSFMNMPVGNVTGLTFTTNLIPGATTATISSYTNTTGQSVSNIWTLATGIYNVVDSNSDGLLATFTNGSNLVTFTNAVVRKATGTYTVNIINASTSIYRAYVSKVDGNLYFANGRALGRISLTANANAIFYPSVPGSYSVNYFATGTLNPLDSIVDMADLQTRMLIAGQYDIYPWDYVSPQPSAPVPIGEKIVRMINILNNVHVTAGTKGSVYVSNGYSAQLLTKLPDFIAGVIDPIWKWGGVMAHRSKLWLQATAQNSSGTNILAGIFSMIVSPGLLGEQPAGLIMEAQNSYGLTPTSGALQNGVLIDNETWSSGVDSYYSAWSNGAITGGVDYNDTSAWQNYEPTIETDMIPLGGILNKKTLGNIEFKLDRPMLTGDSIKISWRSSLSSSYTLLGTSTTTQLSEYYPSNISQSQWAQFKVQMKCASGLGGTSYIPLREIRLHLK